MVESVETPTTTSRRSILCEHSLLQDRKHKKICPWWCIWPKSYTFVFLQFLVGLHSSVAGVKYDGNHSLVRLSYWLWSGIFHEIAIINTTFAQTLRGEGKKQKKKKCACGQGETKPEMCHAIWLLMATPVQTLLRTWNRNVIMKILSYR